MASNILTLTRLENQQIITDISTFRLDEQIRACILLLEKEWNKKNINLDIELEEVQFTSNEEMLAQVWLNLFSNAIKFSREGGDIRVYCGRMGKNVRVEIEDHGVGMDAETKKHIFEQFYQGAGSRATAGNGLELTIAKRIVELARNIRVKVGRYNQHVSSHCLLAEIGHNANTLEQAMNAAEFLAEAIANVADVSPASAAPVPAETERPPLQL